MNMQPFPSMTGLSSQNACQTIDVYRKQLAAADNGPADHNQTRDRVELNYDGKVSLTAQLTAGGRLETRYQNPDCGVTICLVEKDEMGSFHTNVLAAVNRTPTGSYSGNRVTTVSVSKTAVEELPMSPAEAEFFFNLHDPGLKPTAPA